MVSDKTIHTAFRVHKTQNTLEKKNIFTINQYFGFKSM